MADRDGKTDLPPFTDIHDPLVDGTASLTLESSTERDTYIAGHGKLTFLDHLGQSAISVYEGWAAGPDKAVLAPLWGIQVYVTFTGAVPETIAQDILDAASDAMNDYFSQRIDAYQLPGASLDDCLAHYLGEKSARQGQALAFPDHEKPFENYLVSVDKENWKEAGVSLVAFGRSGNGYAQSVQHGVKITGAKGYYAADKGFLGMVSDELDPGTLGEALISLYPNRHEDERYTEALDQGRESWT